VGDKRISIRTLPSGERVNHFPPDDRHPDGMLVLIRDHSALKDRLLAARPKRKLRHEAIHAGHIDRIKVKVANQKAKGLPPEKSPI
jgi:hypothetical protein